MGTVLGIHSKPSNTVMLFSSVNTYDPSVNFVVDRSGYNAVAVNGTNDEFTEGLLTKIEEGYVDFEEILEKGYFPELMILNNARSHHNGHYRAWTSILLATRLKGVGMHSYFGSGVMQTYNVACFGSGVQYVGDFIRANLGPGPDPVEVGVVSDHRAGYVKEIGEEAMIYVANQELSSLAFFGGADASSPDIDVLNLGSDGIAIEKKDLSCLV